MQLGQDQITNLILRSLVRKLIQKGVLSDDEVRSILTEAAHGLDVIGSDLTDHAVKNIVETDLIPAFIDAATLPE